MLAVVERHLHEPEGSVVHGKMLAGLRAQSHLYSLDGSEEQLAQSIVELIECNSVLECGTGLEQVCLLVGLHRAKIGGETEVTYFALYLGGEFFIVDDETLRFQSCYLVGNAQGLFGIDVHIVVKIKDPPWFAGQREAWRILSVQR